MGPQEREDLPQLFGLLDDRPQLTRPLLDCPPDLVDRAPRLCALIMEDGVRRRLSAPPPTSGR
ncbi:MAG: hypothetical protein BGO11_09270 [Solirubrobacterales bacterium 70-9]|nr:MAG: hypothetical protein BGO11_09270 [Solirubrobacterales bacterium 70-9]